MYIDGTESRQLGYQVGGEVWLLLLVIICVVIVLAAYSIFGAGICSPSSYQYLLLNLPSSAKKFDLETHFSGDDVIEIKMGRTRAAIKFKQKLSGQIWEKRQLFQGHHLLIIHQLSNTKIQVLNSDILEIYTSETGTRLNDNRGDGTRTIRGDFSHLSLLCDLMSDNGVTPSKQSAENIVHYTLNEKINRPPSQESTGEVGGERAPLMQEYDQKKVGTRKTRQAINHPTNEKQKSVDLIDSPTGPACLGNLPTSDREIQRDKETHSDILDDGSNLHDYMMIYYRTRLDKLFAKHHVDHNFFKSSTNSNNYKLKITGSENAVKASVDEYTDFYLKLDESISKVEISVKIDATKEAVFENEAKKSILGPNKFLLLSLGNGVVRVMGPRDMLPEVRRLLQHLGIKYGPVACSVPPAKLEFQLINGIQVKIYQENLIKVKCDAIVNPANPRLQHGGGAAKAIALAAGSRLSKECDAYVKDHGKLQISHVMHSTAGKLEPILYVIHVAGPNSGDFPDPGDQIRLVEDSFFNCLKHANNVLQVRSIAIPAISSGIYGIPKDTVARAAYTALKKYEQDVQNFAIHLKEVNFVNIDQETTEMFVTIFGSLLQQEGKNGKKGRSVSAERVRSASITNDELSKRAFSAEPQQRQRQLKSNFVFESVNPSSNDMVSCHEALIRSPSAGSITGNMTPSKGRNKELSVFTPPNEYVSLPGPLIKRPSAGNIAGNVTPSKTQKMDFSIISAEKVDDCVICMEPMTEPKTLPCGHKFCSSCIKQSFEKCQPKCPSCGRLFGVQKGNQPGGSMDVKTLPSHLPGYERYQTLEIAYYIPDGVQNDTHPNPGTRYNGTTRIAYLPASPEGQEVCNLLKAAFDARLIFTVGRSITNGLDNQVIWNDIHHKTSYTGQYGYPDANYLSRVKDELAAKGIVPASSPNAASKQTTI